MELKNELNVVTEPQANSERHLRDTRPTHPAPTEAPVSLSSGMFTPYLSLQFLLVLCAFLCISVLRGQLLLSHWVAWMLTILPELHACTLCHSFFQKLRHQGCSHPTPTLPQLREKTHSPCFGSLFSAHLESKGYFPVVLKGQQTILFPGGLVAGFPLVYSLAFSSQTGSSYSEVSSLPTPSVLIS